ncbi:mucin-13 isoform X2 [Dendropsophus ebraccatus]|uniref:mucin-13 isoform X2 n=1 Tax=Dendropsophus ebraccatus TaxID=150705 RepID=UPI00383178F6
MRGVVAFCLIFLVIPGLEVNAANTSANSTESTTTSANTTQSTTTSANTTQSTTTSANSTESTITSANSTESTTTSANTTQSTTTSANTTQSTTTSANSTESTITSANSTESTITSANTTQSTITSANSTESTITSANTTQSAITSANTTQSTIISANTTQSAITSANGSSSDNATATSTSKTPGSVSDTDSAKTTSVTPTEGTNQNVTDISNPTMMLDTKTSGTPKTNNPSDTTTEKSTASVTTAKPPSCSDNPCGKGSTCLQLYDTYECQCPLNYRYDVTNKTCTGGKSFYGEFILKGVTFDSSPASEAYTALYREVLNVSAVSFTGQQDYLGTVVLKMSAVASKSQTRNRRSVTDVSAKVTQLFSTGTKLTEAEVTDAIKKNLQVAEYSARTICNGFYCDEATTECQPTPDGQGATCTCLNGFYSSSVEHAVTTCRDCSPDCYLDNTRYCNLDSKSVSSCDCRPGYKINKDTCQKCDFGYSGVNCEDNYQLILVIVGVVLGVAVLALLGAVIGVAVSSKKGKKYEDRTALINRDETAFGNGSPAPIRLFPKVQAKPDLGAVNNGANVYDDNEEYNRNIPKRDYDENPWYEMAKKERNY